MDATNPSQKNKNFEKDQSHLIDASGWMLAVFSFSQKCKWPAFYRK